MSFQLSLPKQLLSRTGKHTRTVFGPKLKKKRSFNGFSFQTRSNYTQFSALLIRRKLSEIRSPKKRLRVKFRLECFSVVKLLRKGMFLSIFNLRYLNCYYYNQTNVYSLSVSCSLPSKTNEQE